MESSKKRHKSLLGPDLRRSIPGATLPSVSSFRPSASPRQVLALACLGLLGAGLLSLARRAGLAPADLTYNNGTEVSTLDPATVSGVPEGRIIRALFEGLCIKHPRTLAALPGMAESWEISNDRRTYTFKIRAGALWSNGDPVTADDFEYSWRRMLHPATAAEYAYQLWYIEGSRQYTMLADEFLYTRSHRRGLWFEELGEGRLRVGLTGYAAEAAEREAELELRGLTRCEKDQAFCSLGTAEFSLPFDLEDVRWQPSPPQDAGHLAEYAYGDAWLMEGQASEATLAALRAAGEIIPGDVFRREVVEPELLGLRATSEQLFEVKLLAATPYFLDIVAFYPVFPVNRRNIEEAQARWPGSWEMMWLHPENIVTNGPYRIEFRRINDRIRLRKNETYWDADSVALETIDALAVDHLGTSLNLYLTGELDWIDRPTTQVIPRLMPREDFNPAAYLGVYFYRFNTARPPFDDARVRRALSLAVDREALTQKITKAGEKPAFGFCPPGMGAYPMVEFPHAQDMAANLREARQLLAKAGFGPEGKEFPTFEVLYNTDQTHKDIAEVLANDWKRHLGIKVKLLNQEWKVYLDSQKNMDYEVSRSAWIGDYADPNTFLDMFVSGGENNRTGWGNPRYDELIRLAASEPDKAHRLEHFVAAETVLLEELPIMPLYYYVTRNLVNPRLGGFFENVQDEHFPKFWYWLSDEELAEKRAAQPADWLQVPAGGPSLGLHPPSWNGTGAP
jgi:oligopeptide transport system substrate-binding protein